MKITVNHFVLAEMSGPVGVRDFKIVNERLVEAARFLRAESGAFYDRKNRATLVTFAVTRLHGSVRDAELFLLAHELQVPGSGRVTFTARTEDGREVARHLDAAIVGVTESRYVGQSTYHSYAIKGGRLLTQRPA